MHLRSLLFLVLLARPSRATLSYPMGSIDLLNRTWINYTQVVRTCPEWKPSATAAACRHGAPGATPQNYEGINTSEPFKCTMNHICTIPMSSGTQWISHRIGPFSSEGGYDWHFVVHQDLFDLRAILAKRNLTVVVAITMATDKQLNPLPWPPIHMHHSHMGIVPGGDFQRNHHDNTCYPDLGGVLCNVARFPKGSGVRLNGGRRIYFDALMNDVRSLGSAPIEFFLETAIRVVQRRKRWPVNMLSCNLHPRLPLVGWTETFLIPPTRPSVVWSTVTMPSSGKFLNFFFHTHEAQGFMGAIIFEGRAGDLLPRVASRDVDTDVRSMCGSKNFSKAAACKTVRNPKTPENITLGVTEFVDGLQSTTDVSTFQQRLRTRASAIGSRVVCSFQADRRYGRESGDYQPRSNCTPGAEFFEAGQIWALFTFFDPTAWGVGSKDELHMHLAWHAYYVPKLSDLQVSSQPFRQVMIHQVPTDGYGVNVMG